MYDYYIVLFMIELSIQQLRGLIGLRVQYLQCQCLIVEVLEDGPSIVLEDCTENTVIQPNQHGTPNRRVPGNFTIPVLSPDKHELSSEFLTLDLLDAW